MIVLPTGLVRERARLEEILGFPDGRKPLPADSTAATAFYDVPGPDVWDEVLRVMKPGAWMPVFAGRRNYDLIAGAIRTAGFVIVDMGIWVFRNGSRPPSRNQLRPAHEGIVIARAPGKPLPVNRDAGRVP